MGFSTVGTSLYTTKNIKSYPADATGVDFSSTTTAWGYGSWVELVPANTITVDFIIVALALHRADTLREALIEIGVGASGSEVTKIQIPLPPVGTQTIEPVFTFIILPIPFKVTANSRVAVRAADSEAAVNNYNDSKIMYIELPI